jgi:hypothetical protein
MAVCQDIPAGEGILGILTEYCPRESLYYLLHEMRGLHHAIDCEASNSFGYC